MWWWWPGLELGIPLLIEFVFRRRRWRGRGQRRLIIGQGVEKSRFGVFHVGRVGGRGGRALDTIGKGDGFFDVVVAFAWSWSGTWPGSGESWAFHNEFPQFRDGYSLPRVTLKDPSQYGIELRREGQNWPEKLRIPQICTKSGILGRGLFPWVAATGQIHQDNSKTPYIIWCRSIARKLPWWCTVAFCFGTISWRDIRKTGRTWKQRNITWWHVESRSATKIRRVFIGCGESKVCKFDSHSTVCDQDVLWLKIPMINPNGVTILYGIQNLEERMLGQDIVPNKMSSFGNVRE